MTTDGLTPGEVSRQLGVPVTTLRTWHRRYGLGPTGHRAGHHRRYTAQDMARLTHMQRLLSRGATAAEAARAALDGSPGRLSPPSTAPAARVKGLARAATNLDTATITRIIGDSVRQHGVVAAWEHLVRPVFTRIGARSVPIASSIEVEHLLSRSVLEVFWSIHAPATPPRALLACTAEEQHTLPIEALAAALAERGHASRVLGARVPVDALASAIRRTGPAVVFVWSQTTRTGDPAQLRTLLAAGRRRPTIAATGPGWPAHLPDPVQRPDSLQAALELALPLLS